MKESTINLVLDFLDLKVHIDGWDAASGMILMGLRLQITEDTPLPLSRIPGVEITDKDQTTICCRSWYLTHKSL